MDATKQWIVFCLLWIVSSSCLSADFINIIFLPDFSNSFECSEPGVEFKVTDNSTIGILGTFDCDSIRPTYGSTNDQVSNTFSRGLVPWRYSWKGAFTDGAFIQALIGVEKSKFRSDLGSTANVTFIDLGAHFGYQWFWKNGFNISVLGGIAYLVETSSDQKLEPGESQDIIDYLDKNTDSNVHGAFGAIIGWKF